jgi:D-sedoheptulose 7-phosphate isomerase
MTATEHLDELRQALGELEADLDRLDRWGMVIADVLLAGGRLLAAGNGGSAAQAQHLTAELVGRYRDERRPLSAIALHADTSAFTAVVNDYGQDMGFARAVRAHGRSGDVLIALSTSGNSPNVVHAAAAARTLGLRVFGLTGARPNSLVALTDDAVTVQAPTPTVQEVHQVAIHLICEAIDRVVLATGRTHGERLEIGASR